MNFEEAVEKLPVGIYVIQDGVFKYVNTEVPKILGYEREELMGEKYLDFVARESRGHIDNRLSKKNGPAHYLFKCVTQSGEKKSLEAYSVDYTYENNPAILGVLLDVDEREQKKESEEVLHSMLRHDLRNKAHIARGYLELVRDHDLPNKVARYMRKTDKAIKDGVKLIEKVRTLRTLDEEELSEINLRKVISTVLEELKAKVEEKGIEVKREDFECRVKGIPLLKELFLNLVDNSIRHADCSLIQIRHEETEDECRIIAEDDGKGIPDEDKEKIFDRGFKLGETAGGGLGLALVREITQKSNGRVEVKDSELGGVRFDVILEIA